MITTPITFRVLSWVIAHPAVNWTLTHKLMGLNYWLNRGWIEAQRKK